jgi:hypothetical protein
MRKRVADPGGRMRRLQFFGVFFLCGLPLAAQNCPAINFRNASQANLTGHIDSGLERQPDGSFTLHSYTANHSIASVQQLASTPDYQQTVESCSGRTPGAVVPPAGWSFLGANLLETMPRNPAGGAFLGPGSAVGLCLFPCGLAPSTLQMVVATAAGNIASSPSYRVTEGPYSVVTADLNHDGLTDVIVPDGDTNAVFIYLMQADGTLGTPTQVAPNSGAFSVVAADFDGDGNIDLAVTGAGQPSISGGTNLVTVLLGKGDGTFKPPTTLSTGDYPTYIAAGDLNGDGKPDLVVVTNVSISVHFGNGDGTFQPPQTIRTPGSGVFGIAIGDLNKDGKPDIVASDPNDGLVLILLNAGGGTFPTVTGYFAGEYSDLIQFFLMDFDWDGNPDIVFGAGHPDVLIPAATYTHVVTVLFGNGSGTFYGIPAYSAGPGSGDQPGGVAIADFNGDGKPDAIAGSLQPFSTLGAATVLLGNGDGTFNPQVVTSQQGCGSVAAADFDKDGKMDFVCTNPNGISVFLGNGNGTFQSPNSIPTASTGTTAAATGDFNGDGKPDFAVVDSMGGTSSTASIYLGNGNGTFQTPKTTVVGSAPQALQAVDVNGDGKLDLVVTNAGTFGTASDPGSMMVLLGNGDGTFQTPTTYASGSNPAFTLAADINGDGKPDLITSTELDPTKFAYGLSIRLNQGGGNFGPAQMVASEFGPTGIGAGNFTGNGKVDLLVGHCCGDTQMGYFLGNGDGTFQPEVLMPFGGGQQNVAVADLNGDGKPDAMFSAPGPFVAAMTNITGTTVGGPTPITIQTVPAGLQFTVDGGTAQTAPQTVSLSQGTHTIAVATPQPGTAGTQYVFASWSDGGAVSHSITVGASAATYTATFTTQYLLTTAVAPAGSGSVSASPTSPSGYYNAGTSVQLTATANPGDQFSGWSGALSGSANPQSIALNAPAGVTANFSTSTGSCSITLSATSASLPPTGTSTVETCPNNSGQPNCGVTPEIPRSFTVTPAAGCGPWTATSSNAEFLQMISGSGSGTGTVTYALLNNTHTLPQNYSITVASGSASAIYSVNEAGSGDNQVYREVYALYEQLLGRDPDPAGFAFWTGAGGAGLGQMADSFLTSPEAFNGDFLVMATYQAATGAPPTFAQYTTAVGSIRSGAQTPASLFNSLTGPGYTATTLYQNLLSRAPSAAEIDNADSAGLAQWFQTLIGYPGNVTPMSTPNDEFQSTGSYHTDHTNALYIRMLYFVTLSRDPDPAGFTFWVGIANSGGAGLLFQGNAGYGTRIQILGPGTPNQGFIGSPEFQGLFAN